MVTGYINSVLRLSRLSFVRALTALAIAIASPAVEVGHGLAHEHEHEHAQETSHHDDRTVSAADHAPDHLEPHPEIDKNTEPPIRHAEQP